MAITGVNTYLAMIQFNGKQEDFISFRNKLAQELINNLIDQDKSTRKAKTRSNKHKRMEHSLLLVPSYSQFVDGKWEKVYKLKYQQKLYASPGCKTSTMFYCPCSL